MNHPDAVAVVVGDVYKNMQSALFEGTIPCLYSCHRLAPKRVEKLEKSPGQHEFE